MQFGVDGPLLTSGQAACRLGISRSTLLRAVKRGAVTPVLRIPCGHLHFHLAAVDAYARQRAPSPMGGTGAVAADASGSAGLDAREEFLSSATHDLKNVLTGILGHAQLAQRGLDRLRGPEATPLALHTACVITAAKRMAGMLEELSDLTRLRMGATLDLERQPCDLVALARRVLAQHAGLTEHRLILDTSLSQLQGLVDPARLERVLGNLLANALKYSPQGGEVTVTVTCQAGEAVIAVRDHGLGIPQADLLRIFERFQRAGNVAGCIPGAGIGLASAQQIVDQHGGTISVESVEGSGSTFTVRLPLAGRQAAPGCYSGPRQSE